MSSELVKSGGGGSVDMMNQAAFAQVHEIGKMFAASKIVPEHYRGNLPDCVIAYLQATRMGIDPFSFMQSSYVVHGKAGIESKLAISLINTSGMFVDSLDYEEDGGDASKNGYRVRCIATRKSTGKAITGPWIDWALVQAEKWETKQGSKWKTMPQLMFMYRAAMFFARLHCPELLLGFQTVEELKDVGPRDITVKGVDCEAIDTEIVEAELTDNFMPMESFNEMFPKWEGIVLDGKKTPEQLLVFLESKNVNLSPDQKQTVTDITMEEAV